MLLLCSNLFLIRPLPGPYTATVQLNATSKKQFRKNDITIITDLDETALDNSYLEAQLMNENKTWNPLDWFKCTAYLMQQLYPVLLHFYNMQNKKWQLYFI